MLTPPAHASCTAQSEPMTNAPPRIGALAPAQTARRTKLLGRRREGSPENSEEHASAPSLRRGARLGILAAMRSPLVSVLLAVSLVLACKDDSDPLATAGQMTVATGIPSSGSGSGGSGDEPTTGGEASTGSQPTGGETGGMSGAPYEWCQRYLACLAVTDPEALPGAKEGFGEDSDCWKGSASDAELCETACITGIEQHQGLAPDEPACYRCTTDDECDPGADESCVEHQCIPDCGNGVIDEDEICELSQVCDDCKTGYICSPLNNAGCEPGQKCVLLDTDEGVACLPESETDRGDLEACDTIDSCAQGLHCTHSMIFFDGDCPGDACCTGYCNLDAPNSCPEGRNCQPYILNGIPPLDYLGLCR